MLMIMIIIICYYSQNYYYFTHAMQSLRVNDSSTQAKWAPYITWQSPTMQLNERAFIIKAK